MSESSVAPLLVDTETAAEMLGLAPRTLEKWRWQGGGPPFIRVSSRCVRYATKDLDRWIEDERRASTSDDGSAGGAGPRLAAD